MTHGQDEKADSAEISQCWDSYLDYLQQQAKRAALKKAELEEGNSEEQEGQRRGSINGQGTIQIHYITLSDAPPWTSHDLEQYESLSGGGVWSSLREDRDGET